MCGVVGIKIPGPSNMLGHSSIPPSNKRLIFGLALTYGLQEIIYLLRTYLIFVSFRYAKNINYFGTMTLEICKIYNLVSHLTCRCRGWFLEKKNKSFPPTKRMMILKMSFGGKIIDVPNTSTGQGKYIQVSCFQIPCL